ncbi:MAG: short-chain dehydrogenase [Oceanospirillaceae bacterium]|nr:short-chain dehydrogenase [Oceanospirillaceae bacterium]MBT12902.1 short-chain dehydrogenase [Oceanospirillaceae bacterium]|tara:strand:+ start:144846 stop:145724 length:879 start_codon:yes stop_codon:yes gene_type:complete
MKDFNNKVAAITGAGSGIGRALAVNLARAGCHLALSDVNAEGLQQTAEQVHGSGVNVTTTVLDVSDQAAVYAWADQVVADHGRVNLIFNNAGVALSGTVAGLSLEDYDWIMGINFNGVLYGTKAFLPHLEAAGEGHVINISSVFGLAAQPLMSGYNAAKFAVRGLTESLRQDLEVSQSCVSCSCVHPGGIKTNIARDSRSSDSAQKLTGQNAEEAAKEFEKLFITTPDKAARVILKGVQKNSRRILIGPDARVLDWMVRLFPTAYQKLFIRMIELSRKKAGRKKHIRAQDCR